MFVLSLLVHTAYLFHHYIIFIISKVALAFSSVEFSSLHIRKSVSNVYQEEDRTRWRRRRWKQLMTEVTVFAAMASDLSLLTFNDLQNLFK